MKELNVLYQSDNAYAIYMGVSICSLLENNRRMDSINIFIIDDSINDEVKNDIFSMVHSYCRKVYFVKGDIILNDKEIADAFAYTGIRKNTHSYLKLFLDRLISDIRGRIVYIDCDTAVEGDLQELVSLDMRGKPIGMVMDSLGTAKIKDSIGLDKKDRYYNSGVMLIDLDLWKEKQISDRIINHIKNIRSYGTVDQDVLNVELKEDIFTLPIKYNLQPVHLVYPYKTYIKVFKEKYYSKEEVEDAVQNPYIIHYLRYIGESPWHAKNVHPGKIFFDKYIMMTPWRTFTRKAASGGGLFKIEKWLYRNLPRSIFLRIFGFVHERIIIKSNKYLNRNICEKI